MKSRRAIRRDTRLKSDGLVPRAVQAWLRPHIGLSVAGPYRRRRQPILRLLLGRLFTPQGRDLPSQPYDHSGGLIAPLYLCMRVTVEALEDWRYVDAIDRVLEACLAGAAWHPVRDAEAPEHRNSSLSN